MKRLVIVGALFVFLVTVANIGQLEAAEKPHGSIAVPDIEYFGITKETAKALSGVFRSEIQAVSKRAVISQKDIAGILNITKLKQMVGCTGDGCFSEIGDLLGAEELISAILTKVNDRFLLSARRINTVEGKVLARAVVSANNESELPEKFKILAQKLFEVPARLKLSGQVDGATVYVDNKPIGKLPADEFFLLTDDGKHTIRIEHPDYLPFQTNINLKRGEVAWLALDMKNIREIEQQRKTRKWWGWGLVGSSLAFAGISGLMFYEGVQAYDRYNSLDRRRDPVDLFDSYKTKTQTFYALGYTTAGLSAAVLGVGLYLLIYDPYAEMLESAGYQPAE